MKTLHIFPLLLALALLCSLCACGRRAEVSDVLDAMCGSQPTLPAGQVYLSGTAAGEAGYADEELLAVLFGDGELPIEFDAVNAFAIRLCSFTAPQEFAVFRCVSAQDAYEVAQMCLRRTDMLCRSYRGTEHEAIAEGARVSVIGKYVLLAVGEDALSAIETGRRAVRG